jgi:large subunit ribosomal protein L32
MGSQKPGNHAEFKVGTMAVPKRKHSNSRTGMRRSHHALKAKQLQACPKCGTMKPSHVICPNCGQYAGRAIIETE